MGPQTKRIYSPQPKRTYNCMQAISHFKFYKGALFTGNTNVENDLIDRAENPLEFDENFLKENLDEQCLSKA